MTRAERERMRATGFPKAPDHGRHRWMPVVHIPTMEVVIPQRDQCWFCGTLRPAPATQEPRS